MFHVFYLTIQVFIFKLRNFIPIHICIYLCYENVDYRCNPREYRDPDNKIRVQRGLNEGLRGKPWKEEGERYPDPESRHAQCTSRWKYERQWTRHRGSIVRIFLFPLSTLLRQHGEKETDVREAREKKILYVNLFVARGELIGIEQSRRFIRLCS